MPYGYLPAARDGVGSSISIIADGDPVMKAGGMTIAWSTVAAVAGADVTWLDGVTVAVGEKGLRYGQPMCEITQYEVQTATVTGAPTGGTFTLTVTANGVARTTAPVAFNATAAAVQAALEALDNVGPGNVTVTLAGAVYTITLLIPGDITQTTANAAGLTGGTTPGVTMATTTTGTADAGSYGPFDPGATDGRQVITRSKFFLLPRSVREKDRGSAYAPGLEGGRVFLERVIQSGTGAASLAAGPTLANLTAALPGVRFV